MFTKVAVSLLALVSGFFFLGRPLFDPDLGFHLAGGAVLSQQVALAVHQGTFSLLSLIPATDFINVFSNFWHDYHWLAQLVIYQLYDLGGYPLLYLFFSLLLGTTYYYLVRIVDLISGSAVSPPLALGLVLPSFYLMLSVASIRPHLISILLITFCLYQLLQEKSRLELISLFTCSVILVNVHVYWVLIPFLWLAYRSLPRLLGSNKFSALYAWGGLLLLVLAGIVSPYAYLGGQFSLSNLSLNYSLLLDYIFFDPGLQDSITEFNTPFRSFSFGLFCLIAFAVLLIRLTTIKSLIKHSGSYLTAIVSLYLYLTAIKYASVFAVLALPAFILLLTKRVALQLPKRLNLVFGLVITTLIFSKITTGLINFQWAETDLDRRMPLKACATIARQERGPAVVATSFDYGSWCRFAIYQVNPRANIQITTDGRTQRFPVELYNQSRTLYSAQEGWHQVLVNWNPEYILAPREKPLAHVLPFFPKQYRAIYGDNRFAVYQRTMPGS